MISEVDCATCRERAALQAEVERLKGELRDADTRSKKAHAAMTAWKEQCVRLQAERDQWRAMAGRFARATEDAKCWTHCDCGWCRDINQILVDYREMEEKS